MKQGQAQYKVLTAYFVLDRKPRNNDFIFY